MSALGSFAVHISITRKRVLTVVQHTTDMGRHTLVGITALLAVTTALAQNIEDDTVYDLRTINDRKLVAEANTVLPLRTCNDLTCLGNTSSLADAGPCYQNDFFAVGTGIYPDAIALDGETDLSLTLLNGASEAINGYFRFDSEGNIDGLRNTDPSSPFFPGVPQSVDHELYVGAPPSLDLREANPGCALMFTTNTETFAGTNMSVLTTEDTLQRLENTSWCPGTEVFGFWHESTQLVVDWVREFRYQGANASLSRCDALAKYVEVQLHEEFSFWGKGSSNGIVVTGGAISGPDAAREPDGLDFSQRFEYGSEDCRPMLPESYNFYNVSRVSLVLQGDGKDGSYHIRGRAGYTPIVTAVFGGEEDDSSDPDVQVLCLETRDPKGAELPAQRFTYEAARNAGEIGRGSLSWYTFAVAVAGSVVWNFIGPIR